jgi:DNA polymerase-3 subunit gamma/tau
MSYLVLARKWRPRTFDQMVSQEFIARTLKNAVRTDHVAHAFLFSGSRGVGKTSAARILAKCLNCDRGPSPEPCNECSACREIDEGRSLDVYEIDGASNTSVDDIRELRENIKYLPRPGKRRVYIIDEVHMLSKSAFNALLKTLEEPPDHVVFIFATTEPHRVPETIQSRCQRFDFRRIPRAKILERLQEIARSEGYEIHDRALAAVAKAADGSMRDAQSLLDQIVSSCGPSVPEEAVADILGIAGREHFYRISRAVLAQDPRECLEALEEVHRSGCDIDPFYRDLVEHFRNLLVARLLPDPSSMLEVTDAEIQELKEQAGQATPEDLRRLVSILLKAEEDILRSSQPRTGLEITLIKMASLSRLEPLEKILEKLAASEESTIARPAGPGSPSAGPPFGKPRMPAAPARSGEPEAPQRNEARPAIQEAPLAPRIPWNAPEAWQFFVETVRKERAMTAALLQGVAKWEVSQDSLKVFCEDGSFLHDRLGDRDTQAVFEKSARECFGEKMRFRLCAAKGLNDEKAKPPEPEGTQAGPSRQLAIEEAREDQTVRAALEVFHGTILDVKLFGSEKDEKEETDP